MTGVVPLRAVSHRFFIFFILAYIKIRDRYELDISGEWKEEYKRRDQWIQEVTSDAKEFSRNCDIEKSSVGEDTRKNKIDEANALYCIVTKEKEILMKLDVSISSCDPEQKSSR